MHEEYTRRAIEMARQNPKALFGALLVDGLPGEIVAEGASRWRENPTWHEEIDAITGASLRNPASLARGRDCRRPPHCAVCAREPNPLGGHSRSRLSPHCSTRFNVWRTFLPGHPTSSGRGGRRRWFFCRRGRLQRLSLTRKMTGPGISACGPVCAASRNWPNVSPRISFHNSNPTGARFAEEELQYYDNARLAAAVLERFESLRHWKDVYHDALIPFAHGARQLGRYYNDAVRPADPYEFVGLLKSEDMLASRRNEAMGSLAAKLCANRQLSDALSDLLRGDVPVDATACSETLASLRNLSNGSEFVEELTALTAAFMDVTYGAQRLLDRPDLLLHTLLELANAGAVGAASNQPQSGRSRSDLERRFFDAVGPARHAEAAEVLRIGRVSWRLRDDDNLLLSRVESQLFRAVDLALERLRASGRLRGQPRRDEKAIAAIVAALQDSSVVTFEPVASPSEEAETRRRSQETPRQLVGQPASPGLASELVRRITSADDIQAFRAGEVLVCDAIQPMMTHLVPLAAAVVERRGGMLIHGAIIAREMGIPCVNGVAQAAELLDNGVLVTVDGHLGIVTVGPAEFDLELS
jgi:phosphohistidine swiveling domain-containing protein